MFEFFFNSGCFNARGQTLLDFRIFDHGPEKIHGHKHPKRWSDGSKAHKILPLSGDEF